MLRIVPFLDLIRWKNLCIILFTQYMARIFLVGKGDDILASALDPNQFKIASATILIAASGYIINDYFDVKIDQVNKPSEVIIGRFIRRRVAILWHQLFNIVGVLLGWVISLKVFIVNCIAITLLWFYASIFKKRAFIGNFMVAGLTGASLLVMAVYYTKNDLLINIYAVFAFGISLIREIIKDIEDMKGDSKYGSSTLPIIWGVKKTKSLIFVFLIVFVVVVLCMGLALKNKNLQIALGVLSLPFAVLTYKIYYADKKSQFTEISSLCKLIMVMGILSMIAV